MTRSTKSGLMPALDRRRAGERLEVAGDPRLGRQVVGLEPVDAVELAGPERRAAPSSFRLLDRTGAAGRGRDGGGS